MGSGVRILAVALIVALVRYSGSRALFQAEPPAVINPSEAAVGLILCFGGFAPAVWARFNLGRNWGMPMTFKEGHNLVTAGPTATYDIPFTRECCWPY